METIKELDVTRIAHRDRHNTLLGLFETLKPGQAFTISNDHNPKPLYYEMYNRWGDSVTWEYLEEGPDTWKVQIGKQPVKELTVGEIVAKDFRKAEVFKKAGIDFCCGGKVTVAQACSQKGVDRAKLEIELMKVDEMPLSPSQDYNQWALDFLADYIVNTHHKYIYKTLPELYEYTQKIARVHGAHHPELFEVADLFSQVDADLRQHLKNEEEVLFPAIKEAVKGNLSQSDTIITEITRMSDEHEFAGEAMDKINLLTNGYEVPEDACNTYRVTLKMLAQFEDDLHAHVHLENNILYPKALELTR